MKFSLKSEYAILALMDMGLNAEKGPVHVRAIAARRSIPLKFLEQVMSSLKKAGLVESIRGAQGGFMLARAPHEITLVEIVEAIEGPIALMDCVGEGKYRCKYITGGCALKDVWEDVKGAIKEVLRGKTVADLCAKSKEYESALMYHI